MSESEFNKAKAANGLEIRSNGSHHLGVTRNPEYMDDLADRLTNKGKYGVKVELEVQSDTWETLLSQAATHPSARDLYPNHPKFMKGMRVPQIKMERGGVQAILLGSSPDGVQFLNSQIITIRRSE